MQGIRPLFFFVLFFLADSYSFSQDIEFFHFYANPLTLNPALSGSTGAPRVVVNYRNQWPGLGNAYVTYHASYDMYLEPMHGGAGIDCWFDQTGNGALTTASVSLMYAYQFKISEKLQASGAVRAGYYMTALNTSKLTTRDRDSYLYEKLDHSSVGVPDFGAGIFLMYNEVLYGGVAVDHLSQPDVGFSSNERSPLYMKLTMHAGALINLDNGYRDEEREFSLSPNALYQQQGMFHQLNLGIYLTFDPLVVGAWYRFNFENSDAVVPMLGFHWKNLFIAYSYDYSISKLNNASGGAHEVSASWRFNPVEKRRVIKAIKCPVF